jgi:hypothetical protein
MPTALRPDIRNVTTPDLIRRTNLEFTIEMVRDIDPLDRGLLVGMAPGCLQISPSSSIKRLTLKRPITVPSSRIMPMMLRLPAELRLSTNSSCIRLRNAMRSASMRWVRSRYAYRQERDTSNTAQISSTDSLAPI